MEKIMTLDVLSNIKGAQPSKDINDLFEVIKSTLDYSNAKLPFIQKESAIDIECLRPDEVFDSSEKEKEIIRENFPEEHNGYLVVAKVIED